MPVYINVLLLFLISISILVIVSAITYYVFFRKYFRIVNKLDETDLNTPFRLKYCIKCGENLDKKGVCKACKTKY